MPRPSKFTNTTKNGQRIIGKGFRRLQCFVPAKTLKELKIICAMDERELSDVIGEALTQYVKKRRVMSR